MKIASCVLLVEDDDVDVMTIQRAWRDLKIPAQLDIARDGQHGLDRLARTDMRLPGLILLDLNMPRVNGLEFLRIVKADPRLRHIPVVVFTASREESDRIDTFGLGVAGYMVKPPSYPQLLDIIQTISEYWQRSEAPVLPQ